MVYVFSKNLYEHAFTEKSFTIVHPLDVYADCNCHECVICICFGTKLKRDAQYIFAGRAIHQTTAK
jgi:hypothetical protein